MRVLEFMESAAEELGNHPADLLGVDPIPARYAFRPTHQLPALLLRDEIIPRTVLTIDAVEIEMPRYESVRSPRIAKGGRPAIDAMSPSSFPPAGSDVLAARTTMNGMDPTSEEKAANHRRVERRPATMPTERAETCQGELTRKSVRYPTRMEANSAEMSLNLMLQTP